MFVVLIVVAAVIYSVTARLLFHRNVRMDPVVIIPSAESSNFGYIDAFYRSIPNKKTMTSSTATNAGQYYDHASHGWLWNTMGQHTYGIFRRTLFSNPSEFEFRVLDLHDDDEFKILDCGCGPGHMTRYFAQRLPNSHVTAMSNCQSHIDALNKNSAENISTRFGDMDDLASMFAANSFDIVVFSETHGYSTDRRKLFEGVFRILRTGGRIYLKSPVFKETNSPSMRLKQQQETEFWQYNFSPKHAIFEDLQHAGFQELGSRTISIAASFVMVSPFDMLLGTVFYLRALRPSLSQCVNSMSIVTHTEELVLTAIKK